MSTDDYDMIKPRFKFNVCSRIQFYNELDRYRRQQDGILEPSITFQCDQRATSGTHGRVWRSMKKPEIRLKDL